MCTHHLSWVFAAGLACHIALAGPPELPEAERAVQDTVDHWGQAFSDQLRLLEARIQTFEKTHGVGRLDYVLGVESSIRNTVIP